MSAHEKTYIVEAVVGMHGGATDTERFEERASSADIAARTVRAYLRMQGADIKSIKAIGFVEAG